MLLKKSSFKKVSGLDPKSKRRQANDLTRASKPNTVASSAINQSKQLTLYIHVIFRNLSSV